MPTIIVIFGINLFIYPNDHNPPHVHAFYGDQKACFYIENGEMFRGKIPYKKAKIVQDFIAKYKEELLVEWNKLTNNKK